ncbi:hypothetical protein [Vibrio gallicus]|uniref:hypothetical protein n=1 Tax=Vibrio gallicus TaxID=190897 RepID=UPI0021C42F08|nr:hypothetical protein [Vibrio gallicus]
MRQHILKQLDNATLAVNFCKNPLCEDFGSLNLDNYIVTNQHSITPKVACKSCRSIQNLICSEVLDIEIIQQNQHKRHQLPCCNNEVCNNFGLNVHLYPHLYHSFGFSGEKQRYRCKQCQSTIVDRFSVDNPQLDIHITILGLLLTGFSPKEIAKKLSMQAKTFNDHLKTMAVLCRQKSTLFDHHWQDSQSKFNLGSKFTSLQPKSSNGVLLHATCDLSSQYIIDHNINLTNRDSHPPVIDEKRIIKPSFIALRNKLPQLKNDDPVEAQLKAIEIRIDERFEELNPLEELPNFKYPLKSALVKPQYAMTAHFTRIAHKVCNKPIALLIPLEPCLATSALNAFNSFRQQQIFDMAYIHQDLGWKPSKHIFKPDQITWLHSKAIWNMAEQRRLRGANVHRIMGTLVESNLDTKELFSLPNLTPLNEYFHRFHALFKVTVQEPRRRLRPEGLMPLLDIYRAWNNLCHQIEPGQTPAVNAGISEKPLSLAQLLG